MQNLMVDRRGQVILIDFEGFSFDHPEWDLMVTATEHHRVQLSCSPQLARELALLARVTIAQLRRAS